MVGAQASVVAAHLALQVQCHAAASACASGGDASDNCFVITELHVGCATLREGFERAPCRGIVAGNESIVVTALHHFDVSALLRSPAEQGACQYDRSQGFRVLVRTSKAVPSVRARLELLHTDQFGAWTQQDVSCNAHEPAQR